MSIKVEKTDNKNELKLEFTVEAQKFDETMKKVYFKTVKYFNIPGFRKGKAPMNIIERYYGKEIFYEDTFNEILQEVYDKELRESNITAVSYPDLDVKQIGKGQDLIFTAVVQTKPEVKPGKYKGIEIKKVEYNVSDEDINHELGHMQERNSRMVTVDDRAVENGDITVIDFEGFVDGKAFEGGKAEGHELTIGSNTFIPGFEDQIIGMKIDEEKDINVKFPEEYFSKELAGKDATFKVKLHEIKKKELPELDDEFAKDVSEFDTLKELKESIKEKLEKENEQKAKYETEEAAIKAVCDNTEIDIPSGMIETEIDHMEKDMEQRMQYQGLTLEQYFQFTGTDAEKMREYMKENAETKVKTELVLEALQKAEKMEVLDEELKEKASEVSKLYGANDEKMVELLLQNQREALVADVMTSKVINFLKENN